MLVYDATRAKHDSRFVHPPAAETMVHLDLCVVKQMGVKAYHNRVHATTREIC